MKEIISVGKQEKIRSICETCDSLIQYDKLDINSDGLKYSNDFPHASRKYIICPACRRIMFLHDKQPLPKEYNLNELKHIAVNFAINCEKGYQGDFESWLSGISDDWRIIANGK